ncbi:SMP-30/gluconolactonase/LRE family protein [Ramlibacter monticola]
MSVVTLAVDAGNRLGECALWCEQSQSFWWPDIEGSKICRLQADGGVRLMMHGGRGRQSEPASQGVLVLPVRGAVGVAEQAVFDAVAVAAVVAGTDGTQHGTATALGRECVGQVALLGIECEVCFVGHGILRVLMRALFDRSARAGVFSLPRQA